MSSTNKHQIHTYKITLMFMEKERKKIQMEKENHGKIKLGKWNVFNPTNIASIYTVHILIYYISIHLSIRIC